MFSEVTHTGAAPAPGRLADVDGLVWQSPAEASLDLRGSKISSLTIHDITGPLSLSLPATLTRLSLAGDLDSIRLDRVAVDETACALLVQLWGDLSRGLPTGLTQVGHLEISGTSRLDLAPLAGVDGLRELTVRDVAGPITGCSALATATSLERVNFMKCYDIDTDGFPQHTVWGNLSWISFTDISTNDAKVLRSRIDGFWNAHVRHARSPRWLATHADNPFRTWADDSTDLGRRATALWQRAGSRLTHATTPTAREDVVAQLAAGLDELSAEFLFDTLRAEQAGEAVRSLASEHLDLRHPLTRWAPD